MPSTTKKPRSKSRSSLKRNDSRNKKKEKEVRELWFNPHATKMGESHGTMEHCDCECQVLRNEKVQRELNKLSKIYSQTDATAAKADEGKASKGGFRCFKKSNSAKRARSKQRAEKENTPRRKSKERDASRKEHEKKNRVRSPSAVRRFKTREEAKRYRELKTIYTTKPRNQAAAPKEKKTTTGCFKRKKDKPKDGAAKAQLDNSSEESVYSVEEATAHESRKSEPRNAAAKSTPKRASRARSQSRSSRARSQSRSRADKNNKNQTKKSDVGCCGTRKKSHADKEEEEFEAYKLAQSTPARTKRQTAAPPECPLTPEEIELLEKLKETYTTEPKVKAARRTPPPPPAEEDTGCCGAKSKKKQRRPTDETYAPRKRKSAELNVRRKRKPRIGRSKSDSSFYGRNFSKLVKPRVCFFIPCMGRRTKHSKRIKQINKKRKKEKEKIEETKITVDYEQTHPSKVRGIRMGKPKEEAQRKSSKTKVQEKAQKPSKTRMREKAQKPSKTIVQEKAQKPSKTKVQEKAQRPSKTKVQEKAQKPSKTKVQEKAQKPSKTKVQEKAQKQLDVSKKKIEKPQKPTAQPATKPPESESQEKVKKKAPDNDFTKKPKEKKVVVEKQTQTKQMMAEVEKKASYVSCCSLSAKDKVKKEKTRKTLMSDTPKKQKGTEKLSKKPSNISCCSELRENLQKKLVAWQQRPAKVESNVEVQKKTSATSCCSKFKTGLTQKLDSCQKRFLKMLSYAKKDGAEQRQIKKPKKVQQQPTQANCCASIKADLQKKLKAWKTQASQHKEQPEIKKKSSRTACCMNLKKEMHNKLDAYQQQKAVKVKSKEKLAKKPSVTSCFSCYSAEKSRSVDKSRRKIVKPSKNVEKTPNPFETLCALCKCANYVRPKPKVKHEKPTASTEYASPTRKETTKQTSPTRKDHIQTKTKKEVPERSSQTSFHTCWDWFDDTADRERAPVKPKETKDGDAPPKSKTSTTSFWTCCSGLCLPRKFREQPYRKSKRKTKTKTKEESQEAEHVEDEIIDKPANMSYCKALYQEFENLITQQQLCPILLSETSFEKRIKGNNTKYDFNYCQQHFSKSSLGNTGKSRTQTKYKKQQTPETAEKDSKVAENSKQKTKIKDKDKNKDRDNENQKKIQQALGASYNNRTLLQRKPRQQQTPQASSEKSTSNSEMQPTAYLPEYVLGKPLQLGVSLAHARHLPYNLITNSYGRKKCERNFSKNYIYGIGCQN